MKLKPSLKLQSGVASLLTAVLLLTCVTLVVLFTSRAVVMDTRMTSDNTRSQQAEEGSLAAMAYAVSYYTGGGVDQDNDCTPDSGSIGGSGKARGEYRFIASKYWNGNMDDPQGMATPGSPNICGCDPSKPKKDYCTMVWARGWSDDDSAVRTTTQCMITKPLFDNPSGEGPSTSFFSATSVDIGGGASIINRYTNTNIWTGGSNKIRGDINTHLRADNKTVSDLQRLCDGIKCYDENGFEDPYKYLNSTDPTVYARPVTTGSAGDGVDIIRGDPNLVKTPDEIFKLFFGSNTRDDVREQAKESSQYFDLTAGATKADITGANPPLTGLIWVKGNLSLNTGDIIGRPSTPIILIVEGDFSMMGGTVYGAVYVTGKPEMKGTATLKGSLVSEIITPPGSPGAGNAKLVYVPFGKKGNCPEEEVPTNVIGTRAIIAGSWKNW